MSCMLRKQTSELQRGGLMDIARISMCEHVKVPFLCVGMHKYACTGTCIYNYIYTIIHILDNLYIHIIH